MTNPTKLFTLVDIPAAMRRERWLVAASLMDRWFASPKRKFTDDEKFFRKPVPPEAREINLVKMTWAMNFARVAAANKELLATWSKVDRISKCTPVLSSRIRDWVNSKGILGRDVFRFGDLSDRVDVVDEVCSINYQVVESPITGPYDDFFGAFGDAAIKIAVSGQVASGEAGWEVSIDEVATYLHDSYDFNGWQMLGSWRADRMCGLVPGLSIEIDPRAAKPKLQSILPCHFVTNNSFDEYRNHFGRGGDFIVFSDLKRIRLPVPVKVTVPR